MLMIFMLILHRVNHQIKDGNCGFWVCVKSTVLMFLDQIRAQSRTSFKYRLRGTGFKPTLFEYQSSDILELIDEVILDIT